ncbi:MAG: phosphotransferase [Verrucomicrobiota bacterium]
MLTETAILERTRAVFPELEKAEISISPVGEGGSDRVYWRIESESPSRSLIFMEYTDARPDNALFVPVSSFLEKNGIAAPRVYSWVEDERLVWLEDLGNNELWNLRNEPWETLRPAYEAALTEVSKLHNINESELAKYDPPELSPAFDADLYRWEHDYFFDQFATRFAAMNGATRAAMEYDLGEMIDGLLRRPRSLIHRDFQSQNILIRSGEAVLIDYQGMRLGLPEYDVASLVFDPYVELKADQRSDLLNFYHEHRDIDESFKEWATFVDHCAAQRLMQALGAYGYIGQVMGKTAFFRHIPPAMKTLDEALARADLLPGVREILAKAEAPEVP